MFPSKRKNRFAKISRTLRFIFEFRSLTKNEKIFSRKNNAKISRKNGNYVKKTREFRKNNRIFKNKCKILVKLRKFIKEILAFENKRLIYKEGSASQIDGLTQNINCCSYKIHSFHKVFAFREKYYCEFRFIYFREISQKIWKMRPKIFAFFRETFRSLETLF